MQTIKGLKVIILTLGIIVFTGCNSQKKDNQDEEVGVRTIEVTSTSNSGLLNYVGTVEEESATGVSFKVQGNVSKIFVSEGEKVKRGKCLAIIDSETLRQSYIAAKAVYEQAEDAMKRMQLLYDNKSLSEIKYIEAKTNLAKALSSYKIAEKNLSNTKLLAPVDGIIGKKDVEVGENVIPGITAFTILNINDVKIKISVPEKEIYRLKEKMEATVMVSAIGNKVFAGTVSEKGVVADPITHTYEAKILLKNRENELMPGMVCDVNINDNANQSDGLIVIPNAAVQISERNAHFVWLVKGGKSVANPVELGQLTKDGIVISSGLTIGDKVIVKGMQKVSEGMKVREL